MTKGFEFEWDILCNEIGEDNAKKVVNALSGTIVYFPKSVNKVKKRKTIKSMYSEGVSVKIIARKTGLSAQQVRNIINK